MVVEEKWRNIYPPEVTGYFEDGLKEQLMELGVDIEDERNEASGKKKKLKNGLTQL